MKNNNNNKKHLTQKDLKEIRVAHVAHAKSRGAGDTISKIIKKLSGGKVKECEPCKKRREALNKKFPYKN